MGSVSPETARPRNLIAFGAQVRRHRTAVGWSQDQTGLKAHVSGTFIGKIERGEARCTRPMAKTLDGLFGLPGSLEQLWEDLDLIAAFPSWFNWHKIEAVALRLHSYQCLVIDGLLQTEEYARVLLNGNEDAVAARMGRQTILTREDPAPPHLSVLMTESVLHNPVGGKEVMREQLEHLLHLLAWERISIQIIPGMIPSEGTNGSFTIASMADGGRMGYVDSSIRGLTVSESGEIETLVTAYDAIRGKALPVDMSRNLIVRVLEERWS